MDGEKPPEKRNVSFEKYLDIMRESLNKNIHKNVTPYWRAHHSLRGTIHCPINSTNLLLLLHS